MRSALARAMAATAAVAAILAATAIGTATAADAGAGPGAGSAGPTATAALASGASAGTSAGTTSAGVGTDTGAGAAGTAAPAHGTGTGDGTGDGTGGGGTAAGGGSGAAPGSGSTGTAASGAGAHRPAAGTAGPPAAEPAVTYDVSASLSADPVTQLPGHAVTLIAMVSAWQVEEPLGLTLTVPVGTHVGMGRDVGDRCTLSADGRLLTCHTTYVTPSFIIDADTPPGTLTFTMTTVLGDVIDPNPANNTATTSVLVVAKGADFGLAWQGPAGPVRTGEAVTTLLTLTNHGPDAGTVEVGVYPPPNADITWVSAPKNCWADDPGGMTCDFYSAVPPGTAVVMPFTWKFSAADRGKTVHFAANAFMANTDTNPANDKAGLDLHIAPAPARPTPTATTTGAGTATGGTAAGGRGSGASPLTGTPTALAATGTTGTTALAAGAVAAGAAGAALVLAAQRRRHATHR